MRPGWRRRSGHQEGFTDEGMGPSLDVLRLGAMPLMDKARIFPWLCSTTVIVVIPIALVVSASSFAVSPVFGMIFTVAGI